MATEAYNPDFIERNGAWLLTVLGVLSSCMAGLTVYFLKSRCTQIRCCGAECQRDVLAIDPAQVR